MRKVASLSLLTALLASGCDGHECPEGAPEITSVVVEPDTVDPGAVVSVTIAGDNLGFSAEHHSAAWRPPLTAARALLASGGDGEEAACPGGHIHVYLDDLQTNPLVMEDTLSFELAIPATTLAGTHTLIARLHNQDHTIYEPQVTKEATITVE